MHLDITFTSKLEQKPNIILTLAKMEKPPIRESFSTRKLPLYECNSSRKIL